VIKNFYCFFFLQLRQGQNVCTDNECQDLVSPQNASPSSDSADNFTWMMFMMIAAVILYLIRPNSLRRREGNDKASRDDVRKEFWHFRIQMRILYNFSDRLMIHNPQWPTDLCGIERHEKSTKISLNRASNL
jgi:hypothetical protein